MRLAASLAFYTALSLAPLVMIVVGLAGLVTERQLVAGQLAQQIELLMGPPGRQLVGIILTTTEPGGGTVAASIGFATLCIGATAVFGELQAALNLIWEVKPAPLNGVWAMLWSWLKQRVFSLAIVFTIAFLLLVSLVVSAVLAGVTQYLSHTLRQGQILLGHGLESAVSIAVITLLFALLFKYVPDAQIRWRDVWPGGCISAVLFTACECVTTSSQWHRSCSLPWDKTDVILSSLVGREEHGTWSNAALWCPSPGRWGGALAGVGAAGGARGTRVDRRRRAL